MRIELYMLGDFFFWFLEVKSALDMKKLCEIYYEADFGKLSEKMSIIER